MLLQGKASGRVLGTAGDDVITAQDDSTLILGRQDNGKVTVSTEAANDNTLQKIPKLHKKIFPAYIAIKYTKDESL